MNPSQYETRNKRWTFLHHLLLSVLNITDLSPSRVLDTEKIRRIYMFFLISIIGILVLIVMGISALKEKHTILGTMDLSLAAILVLNLFHARHRKNYQANIYVGIVFTAVLFVFAFMTGGVNNSGFVWYYTFPLIASFLLGSKKGAIFSMIVFIPALILFLMKEIPPTFAQYSLDLKFRFAGSFFVVASFAYFFEYLREKNTQRLAKAHDELEKRVQERTNELHAMNREIEEINTELKRRKIDCD